MAETRVEAPRWIFLGTDKGKGIYRARWEAATGTLGAAELAIEAARPDFFAMHPRLPVMYSVNAVGGGEGAVSGYRVSRTDGHLQKLFTKNTSSDGPCAVSVDQYGNLFVANYTGGTADFFTLNGLGDIDRHSIRPDVSLDCRGNPACGTLGPVKDRQDTAHLHCVTISPSSRYILICNLGEDAIEVEIRTWHGSDPWKTPMRVPARLGSGPRHVAFHPNGKWVYCIHELDCTVDLYDWSESGGDLKMMLRQDSVVSTLAKGTALTGNTACEIFVSDDGRFVYTCTRGVDEIVVYRVDQASGLLSEHQRVGSGGKIPRYITLDPSRKWLVCCNQGAAVPNPVGNVTVFAHDAATGKLSEKPKVFAAETPMFAAFV